MFVCVCAYYLSAAVEVVLCVCVHEGLLQVNAGVDAAWNHQLPRRVNHFGSALNHQVPPHLLDEPVLDVNIRLLSDIIVNDPPAFNENPHGAGASGHYTGQKKTHRSDSIGVMFLYCTNCMCYCPTPTLHLNLPLTGDGAFITPPGPPARPKTHSV